MRDQRDMSNDQDQRAGGYGGSTGGQNPAAGAGDRTDDAGTGTDNTSAAGRDNPGTSPIDADEAMGNRTGGYGDPTKGVDLDDTGNRA